MNIRSLYLSLLAAISGCFLAGGAASHTFPEDHGGPELSSLRGQVAHAYEADTPHTKVRAVAFREAGFAIDRSPEGVILRRTISAYVGFSDGAGKCAYDDLMFAEESTGPNSWAGLRVYGVGQGGKDIACDAFGGAGGGAGSGSAAAAAGSPGDLTFTAVPSASSLPPVAADQVVILYADQRTPFPAGLSVPTSADAKPDGTLGFAILDDGYPTAAEPHAKLGELRWRSRSVLPPSKIAALLAEEAGKHGANAVLLISYRLDQTQKAVALHLSTASPTAYPPAAELLQKAPLQLTGYVPAGDVAERGLEDYTPVVVEAKRGTCYGVHVALDSLANLTPSARHTLGVTTSDSVHRPLPGADVHTQADAPLATRDFVSTLGCPVRNEKLYIKFAAKKHAWNGYGRGTVKLQLYTKSIPTAELNQLDQTDHARYTDCTACLHEVQLCRGNDRAHPGDMLPLDQCAPYTDCLRAHSRTLDECQASR